MTTLEVRRDDIAVARLVTEPLPELGDGEALLRVERYGLSANNITYGVLGDLLGYWRFFPASEDGWGRIPAWGFARAIEGALPAGTRAYGYLPMASHVVLRPAHVSERGFVDASPHRAELPKAYNVYANPVADPSYNAEREEAQLLLRPLFVTSFLLDEVLGTPEETVIVTSASSKTALGLARLQAERGVSVAALTSERNREFVEGLDIYDAVATYDDPMPAEDAILVDVAGNADVRRHLKPKRTILVGATHYEKLAAAEPGATFFFAPEELRTRRAAVEERFPETFDRLVEWSESWLRIRHAEPLDAYRAVAAGQADPDEAFILTVTEPDPQP